MVYDGLHPAVKILNGHVMQTLLDGLGKPLRVLAPMVEVNDLAFRMMVRKHGVQLCFTGMINTHMWAINPADRAKQFQTCPTDRPLIIQLNGNDESELIACALDLIDSADAFDINLGCTQHIARRGKFGYFMVNTEDKRQNVLKLIRKLREQIRVPITAKIRLLSDDDKVPSPELTAEFARHLEEAGVSMISVHGRHRQLDKAGNVDAEAIKLIAESVKIPVLANGGVRTKEEADELLRLSGAAGVMVGQGLLANPRMFDAEIDADPVSLGREYLELYKKHSGDRLVAKRHLFNFFESEIKKNTEISKRLKDAWAIEDMEKFLDEFDATFRNPDAQPE